MSYCNKYFKFKNWLYTFEYSLYSKIAYIALFNLLEKLLKVKNLCFHQKDIESIIYFKMKQHKGISFVSQKNLSLFSRSTDFLMHSKYSYPYRMGNLVIHFVEKYEREGFRADGLWKLETGRNLFLVWQTDGVALWLHGINSCF